LVCSRSSLQHSDLLCMRSSSHQRVIHAYMLLLLLLLLKRLMLLLLLVVMRITDCRCCSCCRSHAFSAACHSC
jgi:hypothetical protein